jgi:transposase-like protein
VSRKGEHGHAGDNRPGLKRSWCQGCRRTFNDLTHTLLAQSKRSWSYWILATFLLCLSCSSRRMAKARMPPVN